MFEVIGFKEVDYINKVGNRVQGYNLYMTCERDNVTGLSVKEEYINNKVAYIPRLGDTIELFYNEYKSVVLVRSIEN